MSIDATSSASTERADRLSPDAPVAEVARSFLGVQLQAIRDNRSGTLEGTDSEPLHDLRVATRRSRSTLRLYAPYLPCCAADYRGELKWLGNTLGPVRDLDVQIDKLEAMAEALDEGTREALPSVLEEFDRRRQTCRQPLRDALCSERYRALMAGMRRDVVEGGIESPAHGSEPVAAMTPGLLDPLHRDVAEHGSGLTPDCPGRDYHRLRIRAKRLRYALESLEPVYGEHVAHGIEALKQVQDNLGSQQDGVVAVRLLQQIVAGETDLPRAAWVAIGVIAERHRKQIRRLRAELPEVFRAFERSWSGVRERIAVPGFS